MPVVFIEAPPGIQNEAKKQMVDRITAAIDDAYHIGEVDLPPGISTGQCGHGWAPAVGQSQDPGGPQENKILRRIHLLWPRKCRPYATFS